MEWFIFWFPNEGSNYLSPSLIPMPRFARFRFRENCLIIKAGLFQNYEKEFRIRGIFTPFADIDHNKTVEKMLIEEEAKQKQESLDGFATMSGPLRLENNLTSMLGKAKGNANKRR